MTEECEQDALQAHERERYYAGYRAGYLEMLRMMKGALAGYPLLGGDKECMEVIDRIVERTLVDERARCVSAIRALDDDDPIDVLHMTEFDAGWEIGWIMAIGVAVRELEDAQ